MNTAHGARDDSSVAVERGWQLERLYRTYITSVNKQRSELLLNTQYPGDCICHQPLTRYMHIAHCTQSMVPYHQICSEMAPLQLWESNSFINYGIS